MPLTASGGTGREYALVCLLLKRNVSSKALGFLWKRTYYTLSKELFTIIGVGNI